MSLIKWIVQAVKNVAKFVKSIGANTGKVITSAYDTLDVVGQAVVPVAVHVVQALKTYMNSGVSNIVESIIMTAIPGETDDKILKGVRRWLEEELPKIAKELELVNSIINLQSTDMKVATIIDRLQLDQSQGAKCLEFATRLSYYLSDGKLTMEELKAASEDYYENFVKP